MSLSPRDLEHIFEKLRTGAVPERGLDTFAVGVEAERAELHRQLDLTLQGEGGTKFLRGGYGCGKTFMARLAALDAQSKNFATAFVVVSENDLRFHKFEEVYARVMTELGTAQCPRGAFADILDRWVANVEEALEAGGADPDAADFSDKVTERIEQDLDQMTRGRAPRDFVRVIQTIFALKEKGELAEAGALLSWLSGSDNVAASAKRLAGVKGQIASKDALEYLRGVVQIIKAAGYAGLVVIVDETETLLRSRGDTRAKSMNGLRQIVDAAGKNPHHLWLFTGTPDFFDDRRGVAGLAPLHDRIRYNEHGGFASLRQPQLGLKPFDEARLRAVAHRLRALFPARHRSRVDEKMNDAFIERLVKEVTKGFRGDVGVVPRHFLRDFVDQLDLVDSHEDYDPNARYQFSGADLNAAERAVVAGEVAAEGEDGTPMAVEDNW